MEEETKNRIGRLLKSKGFLIAEENQIHGSLENHEFAFIKNLEKNIRLQGTLDWYSFDQNSVMVLSFHYQDHKLYEMYNYIRDENDVEKLIDRICKVAYDSLTEILSRLSEFMMTGM